MPPSVIVEQTLALSESNELPPNLPFVDEGRRVTKKPRRAGRTLSARLSRLMPHLSFRRSEEGYVIQSRDTGFIVARQEQEGGAVVDTTINLPPSLQERLSEEELQQEILDFLTRIKRGLAKKEDYRLKLDKETSYVTLLYSSQGKPTQYLYIHPDRVDVTQSAFEQEKDFLAFQKAVADQNFNNVAYKKWREHYKQEFENDIITQELWYTYGNPDERAQQKVFQEEVARLHGVSLQEEVFEEEKPTSLLRSVATALPRAIRRVVKGSSSETPSPSAALAKEIEDEVASSEVSPLPSVDDLAAVDVFEVREAHRRYARARENMQYYDGPLGDLVCKVNGVEYTDVAQEYHKACEDFYLLYELSRLALIDRFLVEGLSGIEKKLSDYNALRAFIAQGDYRASIPHITVVRLFNAGHRERLLEWLERFESHEPTRQIAAHDLVTSTLAGVVKAGLLGVVIMQDKEGVMNVSASARLTSLLGQNDYFSLLTSPSENLQGKEEIQEALRREEFHALLAGKAGISENPYAAHYSKEYSDLMERYQDVLEERNLSPMTRSTEESEVVTTESGQNNEDSRPITESLHEFLSTCARRTTQNLDEMAILSEIASLEHEALRAKAREIMKSRHGMGGHPLAAVVTTPLLEQESLFAALQRVIRAHEDFFSNLPGGAAWEKAHYLLAKIYAHQNLGTLPKDATQWVEVGNPGDLLCYNSQGEVVYCRL